VSGAVDRSREAAPSHADGQRTLVPTIRLTSVTGADAAPGPDPTEDYHEASRLYPGITDPQVVGAVRLERSPAMRITASRSVKRHPHRPFVVLPAPDLGTATLARAVTGRRSCRTFAALPLALSDLGSLLHTAYGVTGTVAGAEQAFRSAPSGGALYPLELYVVCHHVEELEFALYHYDPLLHRLELLGPLKRRAGAELTPYGEVLAESAAVVAMTAVFWRSRFKYGARAYRFALTEAGHVAQNLLLAATALGLASVPVGGFYDRAVDEFIGVDGIYEGSLYLVPVGHAAE
jgi:SagB-type dehydrogenase family enzyme